MHLSYSRVNEMTFHVQNGTMNWKSSVSMKPLFLFLLKPVFKLSCANSMCQSVNNIQNCVHCAAHSLPLVQ